MTIDIQSAGIKSAPIIGLLPHDLKANSYISQNRKILSQLGTVAPVPAPAALLGALLRNVFFRPQIKLYDILIVNWRENCLTTADRLTLRGVFEYIASMLLHRASARKLFYVRHNHHPHNLRGQDILRVSRLIAWGEKLADAVVVHSPAEAQKPGYYYVPHPLYALDEPKYSSTTVMKQRQTAPAPGSEYLMIGRIEPYKRIHEVIAEWSLPSKLTIMGPCTDNRYLQSLKTASEGKNVIIEDDFHDESYLAERVRRAAGVIIANDQSSMIVSGSLFFALSCGTRLFVTESAFARALSDKGLQNWINIQSGIADLVKAVESSRFSPENQAPPAKEELENLFGETALYRHWRDVIGS
ncbi:MAG: hypothetical protein EA349_15600 [Halomonadaceae bacterium]|nr:MAG: hypothetical protein EA349_15600 [Halomonadaceae bacterium]